jgi:hypothetical protein
MRSPLGTNYLDAITPGARTSRVIPRVICPAPLAIG